MLSPADVNFLLHCHYSPEPHPNIESMVHSRLVEDWLCEGVIEPVLGEPSRFMPTALGRAWIGAILATPMPTLAYLDSSGNPINY